MVLDIADFGGHLSDFVAITYYETDVIDYLCYF